MPSAVASTSETPSGIGTSASSGTAHRSARLPSPGSIPAVVTKKTRVPAGRSADRSTTPAPCVPGT